MNKKHESSKGRIKFLMPVFLFALVFFACNNPVEKASKSESLFVKDTNILKEAEWLLGTWTGDMDGGGVTEEGWEQENDSTYIGTGLFIKGNDTLSSESIRLEQRGNTLFYCPLVSNQNNGKAVAFKQTKTNGNELVFENPAHDFPQKITYRKITEDSMVAQISGVSKGKEQAQYFPMKRKK